MSPNKRNGVVIEELNEEDEVAIKPKQRKQKLVHDPQHESCSSSLPLVVYGGESKSLSPEMRRTRNWKPREGTRSCSKRLYMETKTGDNQDKEAPSSEIRDNQDKEAPSSVTRDNQDKEVQQEHELDAATVYVPMGLSEMLNVDFDPFEGLHDSENNNRTDPTTIHIGSEYQDFDEDNGGLFDGQSDEFNSEKGEDDYSDDDSDVIVDIDNEVDDIDVDMSDFRMNIDEGFTILNRPPPSSTASTFSSGLSLFSFFSFSLHPYSSTTNEYTSFATSSIAACLAFQVRARLPMSLFEATRTPKRNNRRIPSCSSITWRLSYFIIIPSLVYFHTPNLHWCPACRNYKVLICFLHNLCDKFSISHYPSLFWGPPSKFVGGSWNGKDEKSKIVSIEDGRTSDRLLKWINTQLRSSYKLEDEKYENDELLRSNFSDPGQIAHAVYDVEEATSLAFDIILKNKMIKPDTRATLIKFMQLMTALCNFKHCRCRRGCADILLNFDDLYPSNILSPFERNNTQHGGLIKFEICGKEVSRGYWMFCRGSKNGTRGFRLCYPGITYRLLGRDMNSDLLLFFTESFTNPKRIRFKFSDSFRVALFVPFTSETNCRYNLNI
ncbi:unnamed protein product [Lactuca virosa]|uniref:Ubiquitin-like protease family profile domain-containing protein n=1 Tax=Lactuca virosa TaxID=75947 RepID=A0AAU9MNN7_9ASTR|nr:unnamed protein product [Lactuca virosa]